MSAALTAGVAALIRSRYPRLGVAGVTRAIERGVTAPPGGDGRSAAAGWGHGQLDAAAAVTAATAIVAAQRAPAPHASPSPVRTTASPAATGPATASQAAASPADPGRLLRSLVVDLVVGAGVLIACLIGAIAAARIRRRRRRTARSSGAVMVARAGHVEGHARHARVQPAALPVKPHPVWPATGTDVRSHRRQRLAETPPWPPALPPDGLVPLPAAPARAALPAADPDRAPWEESPAEFAIAPAEDTTYTRPGSSTGPMYVWNLGGPTGPFPAADQDSFD
jgi:hypothetical protein